MWDGRVNIGPILQSVSPYHISTIKQQVDNLEHGTLHHAMAT